MNSSVKWGHHVWRCAPTRSTGGIHTMPGGAGVHPHDARRCRGASTRCPEVQRCIHTMSGGASTIYPEQCPHLVACSHVYSLYIAPLLSHRWLSPFLQPLPNARPPPPVQGSVAWLCERQQTCGEQTLILELLSVGPLHPLSHPRHHVGPLQQKP